MTASQRSRLACSVALAAAVAAAAATLGPGRGARRPNILLISIDTLRADHLGCYGYPRRTSPFIDALSRQGVVFDNAMAPLPATDPSHASLLTGLHPLRHGVLSNSMLLPPRVETMAEVLWRAGYHTMGVTAVRHLGRGYGFDQGFARFADTEGDVVRTALEVNAAAIRMLETYGRGGQGAPFFLFVHYYDAHAPYRLRPPYRPPEPVPGAQALAPRTRARIEAYDSEIRFIDRQVDRLFEAIGSLRLDQGLLACVVSDHGEQFGEHGFSGGHADFYRETVRVPLVCRGPGLRPARVDRVVSLLDVGPSLLKAAGVRFAQTIDGDDGLLRSARGDQRGRSTTRGLLVLGYPSYTRSLQVIEDPWVFVRNLDPVYRELRFEALSHPDAATLVGDSYHQAPEPTVDGDRAVYEMPTPGLEPHEISAVVLGRTEGCDATLDLRLEPRLSYLTRPFRFSGSVRVDYPVSRFDRTSVVIAPARCRATLFVKSGAFGQQTGRGRRVVTSLFETLLTRRSVSDDDELFDFRRDPAMVTNLIASEEAPTVARLRNELATLWDSGRAGTRDTERTSDYTDEERQMLRSLGYIQ